MSTTTSSFEILTDKLVKSFSTFPNVEAVAVGGSQVSGTRDSISDIDLYVYTTSAISLSARTSLIKKLKASRADINMHFWDLCDGWYDKQTGIEIDVMYWDTRWIGEQLNQVLVNHQANTGYATCFWYTVHNSRILYDKNGWFHALQQKCNQPYPEKLREAIVAKNHPILRKVIGAYLQQIEKAVKRGDLVSINHRTAGLLASYFDVLFALNRVLHPGEKKLIEFTLKRCSKIPNDMSQDIQSILQATCSDDQNLSNKISTLLDKLDLLLLKERFDPKTSLTII